MEFWDRDLGKGPWKAIEDRNNDARATCDDWLGTPAALFVDAGRPSGCTKGPAIAGVDDSRRDMVELVNSVGDCLSVRRCSARTAPGVAGAECADGTIFPVGVGPGDV